jgi:hypothetical protein
MTVDQLQAALSAAFQNGFRDFLVGSMVAALPLLWVATLVFYLMRPYAIRTLRKLSLRFGADVFWLTYVLLRDGALIATVAISLVFFYPNILHDSPVPVTASLSGVLALWVLLLKMVRDPDENPSDYRLTAILLTLGSMLYLIPLVIGVEVTSQSHLHSMSKFLVSDSNFSLAIGVFYVSMALLLLTGGYIFTLVVRTAAPKPEVRTGTPADAPTLGRPAADAR